MHWQFTPYVGLVLFAALISGALALWGGSRRPARGAGWFTVMMVAAFLWALCYGLEMLSTSLPATIFWSKMQYLGAVSIPVTWLALVLTYAGHQDWLKRRNVALLFVVPAITLALVWSNEAHELIWMNVGQDPASSFNTLGFAPGIWYWVNIIYAYTLFAMSTVLLVAAFSHSRAPYRQQIVVLLAFSMATWLGNLIYTVGLTPERINLTPVAFALSGMLIAWGLFRYRMLDVVPVARDAIVEIMSDAVILVDPQQQVVDLNPAAQNLFGQPPAKVIGQPLAQVLTDWNALSRYCEQTEVHQARVALSGAQGQRMYELNLSSLHNQRGRLTGRLLLLRDITDRWQAEEKVRKLSRAAEQSASSIVITDLAGDIDYVNPSFARSTGFSAKEAVGQNPRVLKSGEHPPELYDDLWATISSGGVWKGEMINRKKTGELYWESSIISPVTDEAGRITHYLAVKDDITERKRLEQELRQHAAALETQNAELDAYAHTVAHDLKNPLTSVIGYSAMLKDHSDAVPADQQRAFLSVIEQTGITMHNIINELLLLSSVRGMEEVEVRRLDMASIVSGAQNRLAYIIEEQRAELVLPEEWPVALGHGPWVEEVWANYISNAIKYGGRPPRVELGFTILEPELQGEAVAKALPVDQAPAEVSDPGSAMVRFWVRDNGAGIPQEELSSLFTPFERLHQVQAEGHGLGLSIVRRILDKLGGEVGVDSEVGQGSVFFFTLPLVSASGLQPVADLEEPVRLHSLLQKSRVPA